MRTRETPIPDVKIKSVQELTNLIKNNKTILLASIKDLPASQFQEIGKKLRGKAIVKVPKKNLIFRALDDSGNDAVKKLKEQITENVAILFSNLDCFELAGELVKNKSPAKAKVGQEAPEDIEIQAGPTDLVPGPAISELGALGIQIQIEKGKIHIKDTKVIAKQGEKISEGATALMSKLDIKPFSIGFIPLCAFDTKEGKLYLDIKIDKQATIEELKTAHSKALGFSVEIGYASEDTIKFLIGKAGSHEKVLEKLKGEEKVEKSEKKEEGKKEETSEEKTKGEGKEESKKEEDSEERKKETKPEESEIKGDEEKIKETKKHGEENVQPENRSKEEKKNE